MKSIAREILFVCIVFTLLAGPAYAQQIPVRPTSHVMDLAGVMD
ncbi:unnamed protein product, partial [marine sediment metagenome]